MRVHWYPDFEPLPLHDLFGCLVSSFLTRETVDTKHAVFHLALPRLKTQFVMCFRFNMVRSLFSPCVAVLTHCSVLFHTVSAIFSGYGS